MRFISVHPPAEAEYVARILTCFPAAYARRQKNNRAERCDFGKGTLHLYYTIIQPNRYCYSSGHDNSKGRRLQANRKPQSSTDTVEIREVVEGRRRKVESVDRMYRQN
jgi:hypothetical protein